MNIHILRDRFLSTSSGQFPAGQQTLEIRNKCLAQYLIHVQKEIFSIPESEKNPAILVSISDRKGNKEAVELLLEANASIDTQDVNGLTALHVAANARDIEVIKLLIANGADRLIRDVWGTSPDDILQNLGDLQEINDWVQEVKTHG